jgi:hypothetical protein
LPPGRAPAGVVIRVYTVPDGRLMLEQAIDGTADDEAVAAAARRAGALVEAVGARSVCLVAYNGDTGERFPEGAWR